MHSIRQSKAMGGRRPRSGLIRIRKRDARKGLYRAPFYLYVPLVRIYLSSDFENSRDAPIAQIFPDHAPLLWTVSGKALQLCARQDFHWECVEWTQ
jgi:hypothetical protein